MQGHAVQASSKSRSMFARLVPTIPCQCRTGVVNRASCFSFAAVAKPCPSLSTVAMQLATRRSDRSINEQDCWQTCQGAEGELPPLRLPRDSKRASSTKAASVSFVCLQHAAACHNGRTTFNQSLLSFLRFVYSAFWAIDLVLHVLFDLAVSTFSRWSA